MGSASSKTARKLAREQPSRAGSCALKARVQPATEHARQQRPLAFESKNEAVERDAKDPHFMDKLSRLGQVRVDDHHHHAQTIRAARTYRSRTQPGAAEAESTPNDRLLASASLAELLEGSKSVTSDVELETLAKRHRVDPGILRRLGRVVTTPSVDESTVVRTTDERGEASVSMMARWVDPVLSRA